MAGTAVAARAAGRRTVYLLDAATAAERRLLLAWVETRHVAGDGHECIALPPSRRPRRRRLDPRLDACLASDLDDPLLAPLRVVWLPPVHPDGTRRVRLRDALLRGDPFDPSAGRQRLILARDRDRCRVAAGEPAPLSELRDRWRAGGSEPGETEALSEFVARQAHLALERAERRLRGARYKVPRWCARRSSRGPRSAAASRASRASSAGARGRRREANALPRRDRRDPQPLRHRRHGAAHPLLYTRGYGERAALRRDQLERIAALSQRHPVVFLPDAQVEPRPPRAPVRMLWENGHPPNHTAGGINMNFFPVGPLVRRSGVFFIRRSLQGRRVYKFVLQTTSTT
jgi:glycerol-3-phosphate O-acyltransferase